MTSSVLSSSGFTHSWSFLVLTLTALSLSSPITPPESRRRASFGRNPRDNLLLDAQDLLSQFLSTLNLTEESKEPPEYMVELYNRFANDRTALPSANIVRSFKNEDSSPYSVTASGARIHPLLFNISLPQHERISTAELRLFTVVQRARRPFVGLDYKVTIYKVHDGVVWTKEVGKEVRRREREEALLEELVTKHTRARDNSWVSFDLTHEVTAWRTSGCATHRLEVHVAVAGSAQDVASLGEIGIDRSLEGKHNAVLIVFSDDRRREKQELKQMRVHESDLPLKTEQSQPASWGLDTPPRIRRSVKADPCKRSPLYVDFKDIGWDSWIIQPPGYEAYMCNGVCAPPMTSEVSPTKHAMMQTLLSITRPKKVAPACCVPTKLEPISLLYHENGVPTYNYKYEGMVVAECGCR